MKPGIASHTFFILILLAEAAQADVPAAQRGEVNHLLGFVKNSSCAIYRNGQEHDGGAALAHIQKKYDYFRDRIKTTEDFIELSATKSTMSGKYYTVKCGKQPAIRTREWLLQELKRFRGRET